MKKCPEVSVIVPAQDAEKFIAQSLESVLAQSHPSFEVLVGNSGSTDGTRREIARFLGDRRVRCLTLPRLNAAATRNRLIAKARGRFLSFCDADDFMLPGNLSRMASVLRASSSYGGVYADMLVLDLSRKAKLQKLVVYGMPVEPGLDLISPLCVLCNGTMVRHELVTRVGGFDESLEHAEDKDLWYKLHEITRFHYLEGEVLFVYRKSPTSTTYRKTARRRRELEIRIKKSALHRRFGDVPVLARKWKGEPRA